MPFIRYTAKKILMITALSNTLAPMVKTYIRAGVIIESVIVSPVLIDTNPDIIADIIKIISIASLN